MMSLILRVLLKLRFAVIAAIAVIAAAIMLSREMAQLPQLPRVKFWEPAMGSKLFDRHGRLIFEFAVEKRDYLPLELIPKHARDAFVAIEDERFFEHWGIDPRAIARAVVANFLHGRMVQGELERCSGHGVYGVSEGARNFFGKDISQIGAPEAALLAGLVKAPANYSPWKMPEAARTRARVVLRRMADLEFISSNEHALASGQEIFITSRSSAALPPAFAHFIEYVRQDVEERYSPELLWKGGLEIHTTIDMKHQEKAFSVFTNAMEDFDKSRAEWEKNRGNVAFATSTLKIEGAYLALEAKTGEILVWIGGRDFRTSQFNHVNQSQRQPGSAFKPFVWLAAINQGATPASLYDDLPLAYTYDGKNWRLVEGSTDFYTILQATATLAPEMAWVPGNFDGKYLGKITLRRALAASRNLVSIRLVDQATPRRVVNLAHKAGIQSKIEPVLSLGLGTAVIPLIDLVGAYQTFANFGIHARPNLIRRIVNASSGAVLEENRPVLSEALPPSETFVLVDMMKSVALEGTARRAGRAIARPLAGKTGTTQDNRDLWFVGFTPDVAAGGWMGYDNFEPLGKKDVTGGSTVVPWWIEASKPIMESYPKRDFGPPPDGVVYQKICAFSGLLARARCPKTRLEVFLKDNQPAAFCDADVHEQQAIVRPENLQLKTTAEMLEGGEIENQDAEEDDEPVVLIDHDHNKKADEQKETPQDNESNNEEETSDE
ncbi:MAG: transglycosylase domain-containing protein [Elusimicrobia bacterium]|nr:transglycosylase domain-containing protein [Elusimicrobiota bacterium]